MLPVPLVCRSLLLWNVSQSIFNCYSVLLAEAIQGYNVLQTKPGQWDLGGLLAKTAHLVLPRTGQLFSAAC